MVVSTVEGDCLSPRHAATTTRTPHADRHRRSNKIDIMSECLLLEVLSVECARADDDRDGHPPRQRGQRKAGSPPLGEEVLERGAGVAHQTGCVESKQ